MKRTLTVGTMCLFMFMPFDAASQDGQQDRDEILAKMMQKKLKSAHLVLDGVMIADFMKIEKSGEELITLAKSETWQLIRSQQYDGHSAGFIRAAEKLVKKAKEKNIDGVALAYVDVTLSCVRCHEYVREHRRDAGLDVDSLKVLAANIR